MAKKTETENPGPSKAAVLRRALGIAVLMFFFGVGLFVLIVILIARYASKG